MRLSLHSRVKGEGLAIWLILLALVGGGVWFLYSARAGGERDARAFANEVAQKVAVNYDEKYLDLRLSPRALIICMPSCRSVLIRRLRDFGPLAKPIEMTGKVEFTNRFFEPRGNFRAQLTYPTTTATLELMISRALSGWQIDEINLVWTPPPAASPTPTPAATPSPTPPPTQKRKRKN